MLINKKINSYSIKNQVSPNSYLAQKDKLLFILKAFPKIQYLPPLKIQHLQKHPNMVSQIQRFYYDYQKLVFSVIPYFSQGNLSKFIGKFTQKNIKLILLQLCDAIGQLHHKGLYHGYINLNNIFIKNQHPILSIQYHQPKLLQNKQNLQNNQIKITQQKDIYSFGIVILQILGSVVLNEFQEYRIKETKNKEKYINRIMSGNKELKQLVIKMLNKDGEKRPKIDQIMSVIKQSKYSFEWDNKIKRSNLFFQIQNLNLYKNNFKIIKQLDLGFCKINNNIFQLIAKQTVKIQILNLQNTIVNDQIAIILVKNCKQLKNINISGNSITDNFIKNIKLILPNFLVLDLSFTNVSDHTVQMIIDYAKNIQRLDLSYTKITPYNLQKISKSNKLKSLNIWSGNPLLPKYYRHVYQNFSANYSKFQFNKLQFGEEYVQDYLKIFEKMKLQELSINIQNVSISKLQIVNQARSVQINGVFSIELLKCILNNRNLQRIFINEMDLRGQRFKSQKLKQISFHNCKIDNEILKSINLKSLQYLDLSQSKLYLQQNMKVNFLQPNLKYLNLNSTMMDQKQIKIILEATKGQLQFLDLNWTKFTHQIFQQKQIYNNQNLIYLDLGQTCIIDHTILSIINHIRQLKYFSIQNARISNKVISNIKQLHKLQLLNLRGTQIDDNSIKIFSKKLQKLNQLNLNQTNVSDASIQPLLAFSQLQKLFINSTKFTFAARQKLRLKILNVWGTNGN